MSEDVAIGGSMGQFNALSRPEKEHGMVADDIAATEGCHANLIGLPGSGVPVAISL